MEDTWIKYMRSGQTKELLQEPLAFTLLSLIASRARRTDAFNKHGLTIGQALIGDFKATGMTRQQYRTALSKLVKWGFVTTKATTKGTVATIIDKKVYDINFNDSNQPSNQTATIKQPTANHQATTNKNVKNANNDKNEKKKKNEIEFSIEDKTFNNIEQPDIVGWERAYPAMDIPLAILQAGEWLVSNPTKLKSNYRRFLTNWFKREQERGGNKKGVPAQNKTKLFPIAGKVCSTSNCRMPAVYKSDSGAYDTFYCSEHMPESVKVQYA